MPMITKMKKESRTHHYGLDLLRIISMFMIVVTHVLGKGGLRSEVNGQADSYFIVTWIIQVLVYGAVNCYALISGYVGSNSRYRYSKLANIWLQVFFYTFTITLLFSLAGFPVTLLNWRQAFFPIVSGQYWYMSAYFGLLIFMPLINGGLKVLSDKQLRNLVILIAVVFSILPAMMNNRVAEFSLSKGFEMTWLVILYIVGAYLRRLDLKRFSIHKLLLIYAISMVVTYVMKFIVGDIWYWYVSPSLSLGAICLFIIFAKMSISERHKLHTFIVLVAPTTLGVYLAHLHPLLVKFVIRDFAEPFINAPIFIYPFLILGASVLIYIFAFFIEKSRIYLFKCLKVNQFLRWIDCKFPFDN
ncbi:acyltransferase [Streptococcus pseudoporcinus]|uniref:Membrane protein n=1 Tax=Streptococcus pseudoporcinus TaxID=361101 RepID=A0A4U9Y6K8_9STRE|nr:acyltransferase family protein [Streptococcus pseudoporcinus]VTS21558.1 membrane protein [Streptococcus pseudoporcinus]VUC70008.1 membrane protein [Streptococcus pseudoporcinus]VUD00136.1 membrane protein [Streptococcus pseudoporcinus]VUD00528.1 membrane protein [Streptococcus pseudoporcinus]